MLASLTLFLFGCGTGSGTPKAPATKPISGVVADPATGLPLANATVTAYAIEVNGAVATTPLSMPATARSDGQGNYTLPIPLSYAGGVMVVASLPDGSRNIRALLPSVAQNQTVLSSLMVSLATELVAQYIDQNNGGSFTPANIQTALLMLEPFFGLNFPQIPAPATGTAPTALQQNLIILTQAIDSLVNPAPGQTGYTLPQLVTVTGNTIGMGQGATFTDLTTAIGAVRTALIADGVIPGTNTLPTITPIPVPPAVTDTTPPAAPTNLAATSTTNSVALSWDTAVAADGVIAYYVYRNGAYIANVAAPAATYTDLNLPADTPLTYEIKARDAAGNLSPTSNKVTTRTKVIPIFTISGTVTVDGGKPATGMAVFILITGAGSGIAITDADGNYSFTGARAGDYTVTPSLQGFLFTPTSRTISVTDANLTGVDFATTTPPGTVTGGVVYPDGVVIGGITYPPGTIIGGITYPSGVVIGGVTYPTATVVGGVTYPTGSVIGGTTYPGGIVIGGVTYPSGTVVGGIALPPGAVAGSVTFPSGAVTGGIGYPVGTVLGMVNYPPSSSITATLLFP
jgi:hypothetical protein